MISIGACLRDVFTVHVGNDFFFYSNIVALCLSAIIQLAAQGHLHSEFPLKNYTKLHV